MTRLCQERLAASNRRRAVIDRGKWRGGITTPTISLAAITWEESGYGLGRYVAE
jgi:hypothetical protein